MNDNFKLHAIAATTDCEILGSNEPWIWEKLYAEYIIERCIDIIGRGITRDGHGTAQYMRSIQHITDIKKYFDV